MYCTCSQNQNNCAVITWTVQRYENAMRQKRTCGKSQLLSCSRRSDVFRSKQRKKKLSFLAENVIETQFFLIWFPAKWVTKSFSTFEMSAALHALHNRILIISVCCEHRSIQFEPNSLKFRRRVKRIWNRRE